MKTIGMTLWCLVWIAPLCQAGPAATDSFINSMHTIKAQASTVPSNGDVNPYGVAVIPVESGSLHQNQVLVSNFNDSMNFQGTGTTIVEISPGTGTSKLFAQINPNTVSAAACPGGIGLTTALVVLRSGWVIVGSLPTTDGMSDTLNTGCLLILNSSGQVVETITSNINGPWDMTALDEGTTATLFVSNVLNGTILRIGLSTTGASPAVSSSTIIASGFAEHTDPTALVVGPTGLGLSANGTLYVADTVNSRIQAIAHATGSSPSTPATVLSGVPLNGPLGLVIAPNGNIITVNGGDGNMIEVTPGGSVAAVKAVDVTGAGAGSLFGLAIRPDAAGVYFVNDGNNTLDLLH